MGLGKPAGRGGPTGSQDDDYTQGVVPGPPGKPGALPVGACMLGRRSVLPIALAAAASVLAAQSPPERIQAGFKALGTGNWESALREWARDGIWVDAEGRLQGKLEGLVPVPRSLGRWEAVNPPYLTTLWQRHWMAASFDQGAVFFVFDFAHHRGQWRLVGLQATLDPGEALPHLDLLPRLGTPLRENH